MAHSVEAVQITLLLVFVAWMPFCFRMPVSVEADTWEDVAQAADQMDQHCALEQVVKATADASATFDMEDFLSDDGNAEAMRQFLLMKARDSTRRNSSTSTLRLQPIHDSGSIDAKLGIGSEPLPSAVPPDPGSEGDSDGRALCPTPQSNLSLVPFLLALVGGGILSLEAFDGFPML